MNRTPLIRLAFVAFLTLSVVACKEKAASKDTKDGKAASKDGKKELGKKKELNIVHMKQSEMVSPWRHAKVGDWAEFNPHFVPGKTYRHEIIRIEKGAITFTLGEKGKPGREITESFEDLEKGYNPPESLKPLPKIVEKEFKAASGTLKCVVYYREGLGSKTETWLCKEFPLNDGKIKSIKDGKLNLQLVAWGRK